MKHKKLCALTAAALAAVMALTACDHLENALIGCPYRADAIAQVIEPIPFSHCLGGITKDEFLKTIIKA